LPAKKGGNEMTKEMITKRLEELYRENAEVKERGQKPPYLKKERDIWINGELIQDHRLEWYAADSLAIWNVESLDEIEEDEDIEFLVSVNWNRDNEMKSQNWFVITFWDLKK